MPDWQMTHAVSEVQMPVLKREALQLKASIRTDLLLSHECRNCPPFVTSLANDCLTVPFLLLTASNLPKLIRRVAKLTRRQAASSQYWLKIRCKGCIARLPSQSDLENEPCLSASTTQKNIHEIRNATIREGKGYKGLQWWPTARDSG
eukprot:166037-Pelagomonas_calceolata.AAC.2